MFVGGLGIFANGAQRVKRGVWAGHSPTLPSFGLVLTTLLGRDPAMNSTWPTWLYSELLLDYFQYLST